MRRFALLCALLVVLFLAWLRWWKPPAQSHRAEFPAPLIDKQPVTFATRSFDPQNPPAGMPPLTYDENAECTSEFLSDASVGGKRQRTDATHATITVNQIKMTLHLNVTIWVPDGVTQHVLDHEQGHRQISEYFYQSADKIAAQIAQTYMGRQLEVTGSDLDAESDRALHQAAVDLTDEYDKQLDPGPTQLRYDAITDHSRNDTVAKDAADSAIASAPAAFLQPASLPAN